MYNKSNITNCIFLIMNTIVSVTDFRNNISDYLNMIIYKKNSIIIKRGKSIVAKVISYDKKKEVKERNALLMKLAGSWDKETLKFYKEYKKAIAVKEKEDWRKLEKMFKT